MTKKQVIDFVKKELESGNSILFATLGNGGAGEGLVSDAGFAEYLESLEYAGMVEPSADIIESPYYDPAWPTYQFNGDNGYYIQLQAD